MVVRACRCLNSGRPALYLSYYKSTTYGSTGLEEFAQGFWLVDPTDWLTPSGKNIPKSSFELLTKNA